MKNINESLDDAIKAWQQGGDIQDVRNVLQTFLVQDPDFSRGIINEKIDLCLTQGIPESTLYMDEESVNFDNEELTRDYFISQCYEFRLHFSKKRLEHLRKIGEIVYKPNVNDTKKNENPNWWNSTPAKVIGGALLAALGILVLSRIIK